MTEVKYNKTHTWHFRENICSLRTKVKDCVAGDLNSYGSGRGSSCSGPLNLTWAMEETAKWKVLWNCCNNKRLQDVRY